MIVQIMYVARQAGLVDMVVCDTTPEVANVAAELSRNDDNLTARKSFYRRGPARQHNAERQVSGVYGRLKRYCGRRDDYWTILR